MKDDFLGSLLGNPARGRLMRVFIFDQTEFFTLTKAAKRAGISQEMAKKELKALESLGIIKKKQGKVVKVGKKGKKGKKAAKAETLWGVNPDFKHLRALSSFLHEVSPIRYGNIVGALKNTGRLSAVVVSGCFIGDLTRPVDLIIAADNLNENRLEHVLKSFEPMFGREIRYSAFSTSEFRYRLNIQDRLIRDTLDFPHHVLLDKGRLLERNLG